MVGNLLTFKEMKDDIDDERHRTQYIRNADSQNLICEGYIESHFTTNTEMKIKENCS